MSQRISLYMKCHQCNGTGEFRTGGILDGELITCNWPGCSNGYIESGAILYVPGLDEILDKCNQILSAVGG